MRKGNINTMLHQILLSFICGVTRRFKAFPGRWRLIRALHSRQADLSKLGSILLSPSPDCWVEYNAKFNLDYFLEGYDRADPIPSLVGKVVKANDCAIDVGANVGLTTVMASRAVGPYGHVYAFEALEELSEILGRNVRRNGCENVTIHLTAVSDREGEMVFYSADPGKSAGSSFRERSGEKIEVPTVTLDSMLGDFPRIALVKIDVEGAEFLVLKGMEGVIRRDHPYIILELTDIWLKQLGSNAAQVCGFLRDHGYEIYDIKTEKNILLDYVPERQHDVLCVHKSMLSDAMARGLINEDPRSAEVVKVSGVVGRESRS